MKVRQLRIEGLRLIEPDIHVDHRGHFLEIFQEARYRSEGVPSEFVQENLSWSKKGVLRGLHFQHPNAQAKLVSVLAGRAFDVVVDVRRGSPTFGHWHGEVLDDLKRKQLYIPTGLAHGFMALSDSVLFGYKCSAFYEPSSERGIRWDDPDIGIVWPDGKKIVSERDENFPSLADEGLVLPPYEAP